MGFLNNVVGLKPRSRGVETRISVNGNNNNNNKNYLMVRTSIFERFV